MSKEASAERVAKLQSLIADPEATKGDASSEFKETLNEAVEQAGISNGTDKAEKLSAEYDAFVVATELNDPEDKGTNALLEVTQQHLNKAISDLE
jgi:uncharacterized protein YcnI